MLKFIPVKRLDPKLIRLSIVAFLIVLLITTFAPAVNTQNPYSSFNLPELFDSSEFPYQPNIFSYSNYVFDSNWLSFTASTTSFDSADRYYIPFSQPDFTSYSFQPFPKWSSGTDSILISQRIFPLYQNPINYLKYQPSMIQNWGSRNFNIPTIPSYIQAAMEGMPSVFSRSSYSSVCFPVYGYPSIFYPGYNYPTTYYPKYSFPTTYYPGNIYSWTPGTTDHQQQSGNVIGTIGIITDVHYTDKNSTDRRFRDSRSGPRFYSEAGHDLTDFVKKMNSMGVDAAIELGDFIDVHSGNSLKEGNSNIHNDGAHGEAILFEAESIYSKLIMPYYHVIGNWDMYDCDFASAGDWFKYIKNGIPPTIESLGGKLYIDSIGNPVSRYYSFKFGNVLGIVLDSTGSGSSGDNYPMKTLVIGHVPQTQLNWLKSVLANNSTGKNMPVIVFLHPFLYPVFMGDDHYMCKNHSSVRSILEADKNVIAVFNGHHHPGAQGWWEDIRDDPGSNIFHTATGVFGADYNGIKYYNLRGSVIGWGSNPAGPIQKPSNVYYVLTVKREPSIVVDVRRFRTN